MERGAVVDGDRASSVARIGDLHFYIVFNPELNASALYEGSTTWFAYTPGFRPGLYAVARFASWAGVPIRVDTHRLQSNRMTNQTKYVLIF
jgi:hypothetical protein